MSWSGPAKVLVTASKEFSNCWATHEAASVKLSSASREVSNRRPTHEAICAEVKKASLRTTDLKRKTMEAHENMISHRKRTRRITNEHTRSEAAVNNSLGNLGCCVKEAAAAIHSLTCGIPDSENNEIRYLEQASELIEELQRQLQGVQPVNAQTSEHEGVVLVERQR